MGKTLKELAATLGQQAPDHEAEQMALAARTAAERREELKEAEELKQAALRQLKAGDAPQIILLTAFKSIALYSADPEVYQEATSCINSIYEDLAQESFITDNAAEAADRLKQQQAEYNQKLRRNLEKQLRGCQRIQRELNETIRTLDDLDQEDSPE